MPGMNPKVRRRRRQICWGAAVFLATGILAAASDGRRLAETSDPVDLPLYLDNGLIRVGIDPDWGGAIDYLAESARPDRNYVNRHDPGRLIQCSFFGPPYTYNAWSFQPNWPWNPIQAGDCMGNGSRMTGMTNNGRVLYTRCVPLLWASAGEESGTAIETWISLEGRAVRILSKFTNGSKDHSQYRDQEQLAVYVTTDLSRLVFYGGNRPFSREPLSVLAPGFQNVYYQPTEYWAAWADGSEFGVGVFSQDRTAHTAFRSGRQGISNPDDESTNYLAIIPRFTIPPGSIHRQESYVILDTIGRIRDFAYQRAGGQSNKLAWGFEKAEERDGWSGGWDESGQRNLVEDRYGVHGGVWTFKVLDDREGAAQILSPHFQVPAVDFDTVEIGLSLDGASTQRLKILWNRLEDPIFNFTAERSRSVDARADGRFRIYRIFLGDHSQWKGTIRQLAFAGIEANTRVAVDQIRLCRHDAPGVRIVAE